MSEFIIPLIPVGAFFVGMYVIIYRDLKRKDA